MVGCWFTGQGKKGDCVGKKVNGGPVHCGISYSSSDLHNKTNGILQKSCKTSFHGSFTSLQSAENKPDRLQVNLMQTVNMITVNIL